MLQLIAIVFAGAVLLVALSLWLRGGGVRPSTLRMAREGGLRRFFNLSSLHAYVYGRWTNQYIGVLINSVFPRLRPEGQRWLTDRYHGKVITNEQANAIIAVDRDIPLRDLEQIIPYPTARELVLNGPPEVAVFECACRHARETPCTPTQVCMVIGRPFVDFILEHKPHTSRKLTQPEALALLWSEHQRGHLHSAWFKDVLLNRFYAICNCCKCCCGGVEAMSKYGIPMMASSGYVATVDRDLCTACDICVGTCPFGALASDGVAIVNQEKCMGCGVCVSQCSLEAVALVRDESKGVPLDVRLLPRQHVEA